MTKKICETCFDRINEFDRFRAVCAVKRFLTEVTLDEEETTTNMIVDPYAEAHRQSTSISNSTVSHEEQLLARSVPDSNTQTRRPIDFSTTET